MRDLHRLEAWAYSNLMKFNKGKPKASRLGARTVPQIERAALEDRIQFGALRDKGNIVIVVE